MHRITSAVAIGFIFLSRATLAAATPWEVDPAHSGAQFTIRHMMVSNVRGEFGKITGAVNWDSQDLSKSTVEATIDVTSIDTRNAKRDTHLKSADFFDAANYPNITFKSTKVQPGPKKGTFKILGDLTIHGVTKPVTLDVTGPSSEMKDPQGTVRVGASATTKVNRKDFGLKWNVALEGGGVLVGDDVIINIDVELTKKGPTGKSTG